MKKKKLFWHIAFTLFSVFWLIWGVVFIALIFVLFPGFLTYIDYYVITSPSLSPEGVTLAYFLPVYVLVSWLAFGGALIVSGINRASRFCKEQELT